MPTNENPPTPRRNPRHLAYVAAYDGPGSGVSAARSAGYQGDDTVLARQSTRLLEIEWIRDAIRGRGVQLPEDVDRAPADAPADPTAFWRAVATGEISVTRAQIEAMKRREAQIQRETPGADLEAYQTQQREWLAKTRAERDARARTPEGAAVEAAALASRLGPVEAAELRELARRWGARADEERRRS